MFSPSIPLKTVILCLHLETLVDCRHLGLTPEISRRWSWVGSRCEDCVWAFGFAFKLPGFSGSTQGEPPFPVWRTHHISPKQSLGMTPTLLTVITSRSISTEPQSRLPSTGFIMLHTCQRPPRPPVVPHALQSTPCFYNKYLETPSMRPEVTTPPRYMHNLALIVIYRRKKESNSF